MESGHAANRDVVKTPGYSVSMEEVVDPLWRSFINMDSYDTISNHMLSLEKYEKALNITSDSETTPIALVMVNVATNPYIDSPLERTFEKLISLGVYKETGLTVYEALALPTHELRMLCRALVTVKTKEPDLAKKLKKAMK